MTYRSILTAACLSLSALALGTAGQGQAAEMQSVTLNFQGRVGDQPFSCSEHYRLGTAATLARPTDFRLYVSEVALIDVEGNAVPLVLEQDGKWQYQSVALLDFEDKTGSCANGTPETRTQVVGTVPVGDYRGVRFTVGVPLALNHSDATLAPSPLNLTSLWWNWRGGYKFVRVDLATHSMAAEQPASVKGGPSAHGHTGQSAQPDHGSDPGHSVDASTGFAIHLGSTGCPEAPSGLSLTQCLNPNRPEITLGTFDPSQDTIAVDLAAMVQANNLEVNTPDTPPGCMSAPEDGDCLGVMHSLGLSFNGTSSPGQTVFRVQ